MTSSAPTPSRARNLGIDLLRVISVAAVVIGHAWAGMPGAEYLQIWRMPLFFFLAGFFFSTSRTLGGELRARGKSLALPYGVWLLLLSGAVLALARSPWPLEDGTITGAVIGGARTDMPFLAFWFISVLFFAALLLRVALMLPWWVGALVGVGGLALAQLPESAMAYTPLGIGLAPACMAFMLAGHWFGRFIRSPRGRSLPGKAWLGLLCLIAGFGSVAGGVETMNIKWSGFGTFLLSPAVSIMISIGMVLIFSTAVNAMLGGPPQEAAQLTASAAPETTVSAAPEATVSSRPDATASTPAPRSRRGRIVGIVISELVQTATFVVFAHAIILYLLLRLFELENPVIRTVIALAFCWALGVIVNRTPLALPLNGLQRSALRRPGAAQTGGKMASKT